MKPLVDKSPPTGVQEFGGLMKKSCCAGRSRPVGVAPGVSERPTKAPTGVSGSRTSAAAGGGRSRRRGLNAAELSGNFTAAVYEIQLSKF